jgi:hypothetical protein
MQLQLEHGYAEHKQIKSGLQLQCQRHPCCNYGHHACTVMHINQVTRAYLQAAHSNPAGLKAEVSVGEAQDCPDQ